MAKAIVVHLPMTRGTELRRLKFGNHWRLVNKGYRYSIVFLPAAIGGFIFAAIVFATDHADASLALNIAALSMAFAAMSVFQYYSFESIVIDNDNRVMQFEKKIAGLSWKRLIISNNATIVRVKFLDEKIYRSVQVGFIIIFGNTVFPFCVKDLPKEPLSKAECFQGMDWVEFVDEALDARIATFRLV